MSDSRLHIGSLHICCVVHYMTAKLTKAATMTTKQAKTADHATKNTRPLCRLSVNRMTGRLRGQRRCIRVRARVGWWGRLCTGCRIRILSVSASDTDALLEEQSRGLGLCPPYSCFRVISVNDADEVIAIDGNILSGDSAEGRKYCGRE